MECFVAVFICVSVLLHGSNGQGGITQQPEHVHLSYGVDPTQMAVTWRTMAPTNFSIVEYGPNTFSMKSSGFMTKFVDGGSEHRTQYIHRVVMTDLEPGHKYVYHCGSDDGWSSLYTFTAMKAGSDWSPRVALFGDLGVINARSMPRLTKETELGMYDAIFHVGDIAYDMDTDNGIRGDDFMKQIEPVATSVPYMTCPGNHESAYNFSEYKNRFSMPGDEISDRMFYSFHMGPVHVISLDTEYYYFLQYGLKLAVNQYEWVERELKEASKPKNRKLRPWIITMGHRPMYCSNLDNDDCTRHETLVRVGIPYIHKYGLEPLFYKYGVDLALWAHEHSFERLWPIYDRKVYNGSLSEPYTNPKAPVHIITGSAGRQGHNDPFTKARPSWSAFRSEDYGYTRMQVFNATHLYLEQVSDVKDGQVIDKIMLIKDKHGPY